MAGFLNRLKSAGTVTTNPASKDVTKKKEREEPPVDMTPLEKMLQHAGPLREDGSDRFLGLENFGNTCYCNSVVQALFYQESFRKNVVNYPPYSPSATPNGTKPKVQVSIRPPVKRDEAQTAAAKQKVSAAEAMRRRQAANLPPGSGQIALKPEERPDAPEYKKKQAMIKGPVVELNQETAEAYGMPECTFTGLKDIFGALMESESRTGVLSPQRFLDIFKRDNEMFRNSMHQDAHEFYGLVLNDVISSVDANAKRLEEKEAATNGDDPLSQSVDSALGLGTPGLFPQVNGARSPGTGWVHDIFEGVLTSETKCLTCETASQRDETFLDLSIDLEEHSSVTSCLRKFSAEEMLCERNKFHCDHCGGLQEAEKRMKIKRLPKVLALHLKRFKYTEDYSRLQKLFHRVVYPYHLRMFNTTDDTEDPDRLYELYAVVIHIGGNAYHGHYVSVIKTEDRGWLLFDDEMVEPVDKHFVRNFFGDRPGTACAYVLFYQETTFEKVQAEMEAEGLEEVKIASEAANLALENGQTNGNVIPLSKQHTQPMSPTEWDPSSSLDHAQTAPNKVDNSSVGQAIASIPPWPTSAPVGSPPAPVRADMWQTRDEKKREKKEQEAAEKARRAADKEKRKAEEKEQKEAAQRKRDAQVKENEENKKAIEASKKVAAAAEQEEASNKGTLPPTPTMSSSSGSFLSRANRGSKSMTKKSFSFLGKDKEKDKEKGEPAQQQQQQQPQHDQQQQSAQLQSPTSENGVNGAEVATSPLESKLRDRFSFSLGRKKSNNFML